MAHRLDDRKWLELGLPIGFAILWGILALMYKVLS